VIAMPVYYFDLWEENRVVHDETGVPCPDVDTVLRAAREAIRVFRAKARASGEPTAAAQILVRNEAGDVIAKLDLAAREPAPDAVRAH
jgi:hypothetical protein